MGGSVVRRRACPCPGEDTTPDHPLECPLDIRPTIRIIRGAAGAKSETWYGAAICNSVPVYIVQNVKQCAAADACCSSTENRTTTSQSELRKKKRVVLTMSCWKKTKHQINKSFCCKRNRNKWTCWLHGISSNGARRFWWSAGTGTESETWRGDTFIIDSVVPPNILKVSIWTTFSFRYVTGCSDATEI